MGFCLNLDFIKKTLFIYMISLLFTSCAETVLNDDSNVIPNFNINSTFTVLTWNIENFPKAENITVDSVASFIKLANANIYCLQEIKSQNYFNTLVYNLDDYNGHRENSAAYDLDLAVIYANNIEIINIYEIYVDDWWSFPRSPQVIHFSWKENEIILINNHFKAHDNNSNEDEARRISASQKLDEYVVSNFSNKNVIILGDLNDDLTKPESENVYWNFISKPNEYLFVDMEIANGSEAHWSFPDWPSHLDHILITNELFDEYDHYDSHVQTIYFENLMTNDWIDYEQFISDHRPIALSLKFGN